MLAGVAPDDFHFLPRHVEHLGGNARKVHHRVRAKIADGRLDVEPPSGRIVMMLSKPIEPAPCGPTATPMPRIFDPCRLPVRALRSSQLNSAAPRSSASFTNALVTWLRRPFGVAGPKTALPSGEFIRRICTWSIPSCFAAFVITGSMMPLACIGPGDRCCERGGVLVMTFTARQRMAGG